MSLIDAEFTSNFFAQALAKRLTAVDLPKRSSNQHEIGGLKQLLGSENMTDARARWHVFDEDGELVEAFDGRFTYYDCRSESTHRGAEWRLYYSAQSDNAIFKSDIGDLLIVAKPGALLACDYDLVIYLISKKSNLFHNSIWAFGLDGLTRPQIVPNKSLSLTQRNVLEQLEPDLTHPKSTLELSDHIRLYFADFLANPTWDTFPSGLTFSNFAQSLSNISPIDDPDGALEDLLAIETQTFFHLEDSLVQIRLAAQFAYVSDFLTYSTRVQQRRKSRRGKQLEYQLAFIFRSTGVEFEEQVKIAGTTVDFMFPNKAAYEALGTNPRDSVKMLASKSTCKDRWRQVLDEAPKLTHRYLFTLESGISSNQTTQMGERHLTLVTPQHVKASFPNPGTEILTLREFIESQSNPTV